MVIEQFEDGWTLKKIREGSLNKAIDTVNKLDPKVTGLQAVVALTMTEPVVDTANNRITFKKGGNVEEHLDLGPMLDNIPHGINVQGDTSTINPDVEVLHFPNSKVSVATVGGKKTANILHDLMQGEVNGATGEIDKIKVSGANTGSEIVGNTLEIKLPDALQGDIGSVRPESLSSINLAGNTDGSSIINGKMTINLPNKPVARVGQTDAFDPINEIEVVGNQGASVVTNGKLTIELPDNTGGGGGGTATITGQVSGTTSEEITKIFVDGNVDTSKTEHGTLTIGLPEMMASIDNATPKKMKSVKVTGNTGASAIGNDGQLVIDLPTGGGGGSPLKVGIKNGTPVENVGEIYFDGSEIKVAGTPGTPNSVLITHKGTPTTIEGKNEKFVKKIDITGNTASSSVSTDGTLTLNMPTGGMINAQLSTDPVAPIDHIQLTGDLNQSIITGNKLVIDMKRGGGTGSDTIKGQINNGDAKDINTVNIIGSVSGSVMENDKLTINIPRPLVVNAQIGDTEKKPIENIKLVGNNTTSLVQDGTLTIDLPTSGGGGTSTPLKGQVGDAGTEGDVAKVLVKGNVAKSSLSGNLLTIDIPDIPAGSTSFFVGFFDTVDDLKNAVTNPVEERSYGYVSYTDPTQPTLKYNVPYMYASGDWRVVATKPPVTYTSGAGSNPITVTSIAPDPKITINNHGEMNLSGLVDNTPDYFCGMFDTIEQLDAAVPLSQRVENKTFALVKHEISTQKVLRIWAKTGHETTPVWKMIAPAGSIALVNGSAYDPIFGLKMNSMVTKDGSGVLTITDTTIPDVRCKVTNDASVVQSEGTFNIVDFVDGDGFVDFEKDQKILKITRPQRRLSMGTNPDTTASQFTDKKYEGSIFLNTDDHCWWGYGDKGASAATGTKKWTRIAHPEMSGQVTSLDRRLPQIIQSIDNSEISPGSLDHKAWMESGWTHVRKDSIAMPEEVRNKTGGYIETFVITDITAQGGHHRYQMLHVETDAATYKRYWIFDASGGQQANKWSEWVKTSFNPLELKAHNDDPHAHAKTHPFYKVVTFDCLYKEMVGNWVMPKYIHYLGSSDGIHKVNDDNFVSIPYDSQYRCRGHIYFSGADYKGPNVKGSWFIYIDKRMGTGPWALLKSASYDHNTTSAPYPPLNWDLQNLVLKKGEQLRFGFRFQPDPSVQQSEWDKAFPKIGFYGLRSFISLDLQTNDGGFALGETHRKLHGKFTAVGDNGVIVFKDSTTVRVLGKEIETFVTEMK